MPAVYPLAEGLFCVDAAKQFVRVSESAGQEMTMRPGSLQVAVVPFLVVTPSDLVVVDPGLGTLGTNDYAVREQIAAAGYHYGDVTMVLLSHLHKDHAGGACIIDSSAQAISLMFPRAHYFLQEREAQYAWEKKASPSYNEQIVEHLLSSPQTRWLHGSGQLTESVYCEMSGGHTPFHQVFHFRLSEGYYFFGSDVVPAAGQLLRRYLAKYDYDAQRSKELRRQYAHQGVEQGWTFLFFHDVQRPMGRLVRKQGMLMVAR